MSDINEILSKIKRDDVDINNPFQGFSSREEFIKSIESRDVTVTEIEKQRVYIWSRIYLNDSDETLSPGDKVYIKYVNSGEILETTFGAYDKKSMSDDKKSDVVTDYIQEDDKKVICLAVDIDWINNPENDIPFIRTLFKQSRFYEHQLLKREELLIYSDDTEFDYYSMEF